MRRRLRESFALHRPQTAHVHLVRIQRQSYSTANTLSLTNCPFRPLRPLPASRVLHTSTSHAPRHPVGRLQFKDRPHVSPRARQATTRYRCPPVYHHGLKREALARAVVLLFEYPISSPFFDPNLDTRPNRGVTRETGVSTMERMEAVASVFGIAKGPLLYPRGANVAPKVWVPRCHALLSW